ncbi:uncharacterized protein LOC144116262 [Amblyomma americanum]
MGTPCWQIQWSTHHQGVFTGGTRNGDVKNMDHWVTGLKAAGIQAQVFSPGCQHHECRRQQLGNPCRHTHHASSPAAGVRTRHYICGLYIIMRRNKEHHNGAADGHKGRGSAYCTRHTQLPDQGGVQTGLPATRKPASIILHKQPGSSYVYD